jgi:hypothetical protein
VLLGGGRARGCVCEGMRMGEGMGGWGGVGG